MKIKSILPVFLLLFALHCNNAALKIECEKGKQRYQVIRSLINALDRSFSSYRLNLFEESIPFDSIVTIFDFSMLRFPNIENEEFIVNEFRSENIQAIKLQRDSIYNGAILCKNAFKSVKDVETIVEPPALFENDTLIESYVRISLPAFDETLNNAIIYYEQYFTDTTNFSYGRFLTFKRYDGFWGILNNIDVWVTKKHYRPDSIQYWVSIKNIDEDTILLRNNEEIVRTIKTIEKPILTTIGKYNTNNDKKDLLSIEFDINCAGVVSNLIFYKLPSENEKLYDELDMLFWNLKFSDNLRNNRCGAVNIRMSIWRGSLL